jgi:hypothetical protein
MCPLGISELGDRAVLASFAFESFFFKLEPILYDPICQQRNLNSKRMET